MKRTWISIAILAVLVGITLYINLTKDKIPNEVKVAQGYLAPNFTITDIEGKKVSLYDNKGKPAFINFWASWCPPCKEEMPYIEEGYQKYSNEIEFLMIDVIETDSYENVDAFMKELKLTFPVLYDKKDQVSKQYKVVGYPTSFFINKQGVITDIVQGGMSKKMFDNLIQKILKE